jgi:hypothetical protein
VLNRRFMCVSPRKGVWIRMIWKSCGILFKIN